MGNPAKLAIDIVVNAARGRRELDDTSRDVENLGRRTETASSGMSAALAGFAGGAAFGAVKAGFGMIKDVVVDSIKAASDLNETTSQVGQIFGAAAPQIQQFASGSAQSLGLSRTAAMDAANTFATFGKAAGLTGDPLSTFSTDLVGLSADLASFKNTTPEESIEAIGAALRGESEPIRKYGVLLDDATLRARAFAMGLIASEKDALTPQAKALAAQAEILAQTADAQGDFARTSDGLANQQRIATAQWEDMQATLGTALLPVLTALGGFLTSSIIPALQAVAGFVGDNAAVFVPLGVAIGAVVVGVKGWAIAQALLNSVLFTTNAATGALAVNPVFLVIAAVAALGAGLVWLYKNNETFRAGVTAAWEAIKRVAQPVIDAIGAGLGWLGERMPAVLDSIKAGLGVLGAGFSRLWEAVQPVIGFLVAAGQLWWTVFSTEVRLIVGAVQLLGTVFGWLWSNAIGPAVGFIVGAVQVWWGLWSTVLGGMWTAVQVLGAVFGWLWTNAISPVIGFLIGGVMAWWDAVSTAFGYITGAFRTLVSFIAEAVGRIAAIGAGMWNWVSGGLAAVWGWVTGTWNDVVGFIGGVAGRLTAAASGMWDGIKTAFFAAINFIIRGWNSLRFDIPGFDMGPIHWDGFTLGVPAIPLLAGGGLVTSPTLAVIGEAGAEIVSPVTMLRRIIAEGLADVVGAANGPVTIENHWHINVPHSGLAVDSPALQRDIAEAIRRYTDRNGPVIFPAGPTTPPVTVS